jgi:hypothetical protein
MRHRAHVIWLAAAVVALGACGGSVDGPSGGETPTTPAAASPTATPEESPTSEPTSESPSPEPSETTAAPVRYKGKGNKVLKINKPADVVIATITNTGSSNFVVWSLGADLAESDLLVNTIGRYEGTVLLDIEDGEDSKALKIESSGSWTVVLKDIRTARRFTDTISGKGDNVLIYEGGAGIITANNSGSSNFVVWFYGDDSELLFNDIGPIKGAETTIGEGPALLTVESERSWNLTVEGL